MSKQIKLPTLLVIADNPSIRFWVKKHLDEQFFVLGAENRQQALDALNARLDFIIIDEAIETCNALELCKELAQRTQRNLVPIFLITGRLKKSFRDEALKSGVTDFLSDHLDFDELEQRIEQGRKAASMRQKTEDIGLAFKLPKFVGGSLKNKVVVNDPSLRLLAEAKEEKKPIAFLLVQIDGIANLENQEEIRTSFSQFLAQLLREKDLLIPSKEGGFILLLYNMPTDRARKVAERLRDKIQKTPLETETGSKNVTVSIVVSSQAPSEKDFSQLINSALKALQTQPKTNLIISLDQDLS